MNMKMGLMAVSALSAVSAIPAQAAIPLGDTVTCSRNGVACDGNSTASVGAGVEFARSAGNFDFSATGLTFTVGIPDFANPLIYSFADTTHAFTGISNVILSGNASLTANGMSNLFLNSTLSPSIVTFQNGVISFDLSGVTNAVVGSTISMNVSTAAGAVPETATWGMMIAGFGMMGAALRTRRRSATVSFA